jgi:23S rRNA (uridine2552-2'-O)-methyltransferase
MKRVGSKKHRRWADHYSERAKKERYPARSVYKLKEAQKKYRLIRKGDRVLDLGCSPGSWLLYAAELIGERGRVLGIDLKAIRIKLPPQAETLTADILTIDRTWIDKQKLGNRFNVVLSDMAPATTGNKGLDAARSFQLCQGEFKEFSDIVSARFKRHKIFKPRSSRKESKEIFILGMGFRG